MVQLVLVREQLSIIIIKCSWNLELNSNKEKNCFQNVIYDLIGGYK